MARRTYLQRHSGYSKELKRQIKNYNARITAYEKKHPEVGKLPRASYKQIESTVTRARQAESYIRKLQKTKPTQISSQVQKAKTSQDTQKEKRSKAIENILVDKEIGRFPSERDLIVKSIRLIEGDERNTEKLQNWLNTHRQQSIRWKENYLKSVIGSIEISIINKDAEGYEKLNELYNMILNMDVEDFLIGQLVRPEILAIRYLDSGQANAQVNEIERIINEWKDIIA